METRNLALRAIFLCEALIWNFKIITFYIVKYFYLQCCQTFNSLKILRNSYCLIENWIYIWGTTVNASQIYIKIPYLTSVIFLFHREEADSSFLGVFANDVCLSHVSCFKCGKKEVWWLLITVHMGFVNKQFLHHVGKEGEELWEEPNVGKVPMPVHLFSTTSLQFL